MTGKKVSDTWERGNPYEEYVGRWSRQVAPPFLSWLGIAAGRIWLDVGCGTGALCAAIARGTHATRRSCADRARWRYRALCSGRCTNESRARATIDRSRVLAATQPLTTGDVV